MAKSLASFGISLASDVVHQHELEGTNTMLDYDIVLFRPNIDYFLNRNYEHSEYQGKPSLSDRMSLKLRESSQHWRREIKQAADAGKTVFIFLSERQDVFVATGEKQYSGTGKNARVTRIVTELSNYSIVPVDLKVVNSSGSSVRLTEVGASLLAPYWHEFGSLMSYKVQITPGVNSRLVTWLAKKSADLAVGGAVSAKGLGGSIILLPDLDFDRDEFVEDVDGELQWTQAARQFANQLISALIAVDKQCREKTEKTAEPTWATLSAFALPAEHHLQSELLRAETRIIEAQAEVEHLKNNLAEAGLLRGLLFEKGKPLEEAIIIALRILGFKAQNYKDEASEFDVVFDADGKRMLGEAEGKDTKPINIDKLRQLTMNIHEDLKRDDVLEPAKGVLFGNGFRLQSPNDRDTQFTEKCISAARNQTTALITTSDLFMAAQYLSDHVDEDYMRLCRSVMFEGIGLTRLPQIPVVPPIPKENLLMESGETSLTHPSGPLD